MISVTFISIKQGLSRPKEQILDTFRLLKISYIVNDNIVWIKPF